MSDRLTSVAAALAALILVSGCTAAHKELARQPPGGAPLPQSVHFNVINQARLSKGILYIYGKGTASADGGKNTFKRQGFMSDSELMEMSIATGDTDQLKTCFKHVKAAHDSNQSITIQGQGTFKIQTLIDPAQLDTGVFALSRLYACGTYVALPADAAPTISTSVVQAADLVAAPEKYLDKPTVITGQLKPPIHFSDSISSFTLESDGESLTCTFKTSLLSADTRLSLVHAAAGSQVFLEGKLTRNTPEGYQFDLSKVVSVGLPPSTQAP